MLRFLNFQLHNWSWAGYVQRNGDAGGHCIGQGVHQHWRRQFRSPPWSAGWRPVLLERGSETAADPAQCQIMPWNLLYLKLQLHVRAVNVNSIIGSTSEVGPPTTPPPSPPLPGLGPAWTKVYKLWPKADRGQLVGWWDASQSLVSWSVSWWNDLEC